MRKGTFSVENAKAHSSKHNSREEAPRYLIGLESGKSNYYELIVEDEEFVENAKLKYKECIKQNMQKKQIPGLIKETILTLQEHQDESDVKALFKELNKKYGGHFLTEVSVHRDEGHFVRNDIAYYPTKNILQKENDWYICSDIDIMKPKKDDFDIKVDINEFKKVYNYHAHAKFSMFDMNTGKTARIDKKAMSSRIKFISNYLGLEYGPGKDRYVKKSVNQIKDEHLAASNEKIRELAKQKDLKLQISKIREELKESNAKREDYARLEQLNKELKTKIKNKDLSVEELNVKLGNLNKGYFRIIQDLKTENKSLEAQKKVLTDNLSTLEEKIPSSINIDYSEVKKDINELVNDEKEVVEIYQGLFSKNTEEEVITKPESFKEKLLNFFKKAYKKALEEIGKLKNELRNKDKKIGDLEIDNKSLKNKILDLSERIKRTAKSNVSKETIKNELNSNISDLKYKDIEKDIVLHRNRRRR